MCFGAPLHSAPSFLGWGVSSDLISSDSCPSSLLFFRLSEVHVRWWSHPSRRRESVIATVSFHLRAGASVPSFLPWLYALLQVGLLLQSRGCASRFSVALSPVKLPLPSGKCLCRASSLYRYGLGRGRLRRRGVRERAPIPRVGHGTPRTTNMRGSTSDWDLTPRRQRLYFPPSGCLLWWMGASWFGVRTGRDYFRMRALVRVEAYQLSVTGSPTCVDWVSPRRVEANLSTSGGSGQGDPRSQRTMELNAPLSAGYQNLCGGHVSFSVFAARP